MGHQFRPHSSPPHLDVQQFEKSRSIFQGRGNDSPGQFFAVSGMSRGDSVDIRK